MNARAALIALIVMLLSPATSWASLADEQRQGQQLAAQLQSGTKTCRELSAEDFDHIGEYVMGRALGSTSVHQAMNDRMRLMLGERGEQRMHELMGQRFAGCLSGSAASGVGTAMGPGMMGGAYGNGSWGAMMRSGDWSWMMGGAWRSMSRADWERLQRHWMGAIAPAPRHDDWSTRAIVAITLGGALLVCAAVIVGLVVLRRASRRSPAAHSP
jgi:hypothetical protein